MIDIFLGVLFVLLLWCSSIKLLLIFILLIVVIIAFYTIPLDGVFDIFKSHGEKPKIYQSTISVDEEEEDNEEKMSSSKGINNSLYNEMSN